MIDVKPGSSCTPIHRFDVRHAVVAVAVSFLAACSATEEANPEEHAAVHVVAARPVIAQPDTRTCVPCHPNFGAGAEPASVFDCRPVRNDDSSQSDQYPVPLPPFSKNIFPCTRCHDRPDDHNATPRTLTLEHLDIKLVHGPREQWCYDCHNPSDRDHLRLAGGRLISFTKSYELCGQCHGEKLRDWRLGIHGRRIGCWNGKREYLLCVHCHNPHSPKFKPLKPKPRPKMPSEIQLTNTWGDE